MANTCPQCQTARGQWDAQCSKCGFDFAGAEAAVEKAAHATAEAAAGCPSCAAPYKAGEDSCAQCGVNFAKWKEAQSRKAAAKQQVPSAEAQSHALDWKRQARTRSGFLMLVLFGSMGINGMTAFFAGVSVSGSSDPAGTLFLAVACAITAVTAFGVYLWQRWGVYGFVAMSLLNTALKMIYASSAGSMIGSLVLFLIILKSIVADWEYYD